MVACPSQGPATLGALIRGCGLEAALSDHSGRARGADQTQAQALRTGQRRVVLAAGQATARQACKSALEAAGFRVFATDRGRLVLEAVKTTHFDAVLLDMDLPDMGTLETCHQLKMLQSARPAGDTSGDGPIIIVVIAGPEPRHVTRAMRSGADNFLSRPFTPAMMVDRVIVALQGDAEVPGDPGQALQGAAGDVELARTAGHGSTREYVYDWAPEPEEADRKPDREERRISNLLVSTLYDTARVIDLSALTASLAHDLDDQEPDGAPRPMVRSQRPLSGFHQRLQRAISGGVQPQPVTETPAPAVPVTAPVADDTLWCRITRDGRVMEGNASWLHWRGSPLSSVVGELFTDLLSDEERRGWADAVRAAEAAEDPLAARCVTRDGADTDSPITWRISLRDDGSSFDVHGVAEPAPASPPEAPTGEDLRQARAAVKRAASQAGTLQDQLLISQALGRAAVLLARAGATNFEHAMPQALGELGRALDCQRAAAFQFDASGSVCVRSDVWCAKDTPLPHPDDAVRPVEELSWLLGEVRALRPVPIETLGQLPPQAASERAALRRAGVGSLCVVPLVEGGEASGFLQFEARQEAAVWGSMKVETLSQFADIAVGAMALRSAREALAGRADDRHAGTPVEAITRTMGGFSQELRNLLDILEGHLPRLSERRDASDARDLRAMEEAAARARDLLGELDHFSHSRVAAPVSVEPRLKRPSVVLVVDDEPLLRRMAARVLERHGHTAHEASGGEEALQLAAQLGSPIDLLITDMGMPGMNGRELAQQMLAAHPGLSVLLMSGYPDGSTEEFRSQGANVRFLTKPFQAAGLAAAVREVLAAGPGITTAR